jgi:hypothetical protein
VDLLALPLDPLQGYLLSRLDGTMELPTLAALMNMGEDQVRGLLDALVRLGAVDPEPVFGAMLPPMMETGPVPELGGEEAESQARTASHRQLFEQFLHPRPVDQRVLQARLASEPDLSAFCFDPAEEVILALLENPRTGAPQARLIAAHHRTSSGLEALGRRAAFMNDGGVRRALLQNPLLPPGLFRRLWSSRRLADQYQVAISRDAPEQVRAMARDLLRTTFNLRPGEERAELILVTEGRCLVAIAGLTIDGHTTGLLCRRIYTSTLLIQNIARWNAAPPQLIAHLRRQDLVKANAGLRQALERHPNAG